MANITSLAQSALLAPSIDVGAFGITGTVTIPATAFAADTDTIELMTFSRAATIYKADISISGSLGTGVTLALVAGDGTTNVALTGATTAGSASKANGGSIGPIDVAAGAKLFALAAGAVNPAAARSLRYDLLAQAR